MENFALIALAEQLKPAMADMTIRRVIQYQDHGFIFQTRSAKVPAIKVLLHAAFPSLYVSEARPPVETENSDFLMVLRKHLTSAELIEFRKPLSDRILEFEFKTVVPSRELERMTMVVELIPNAPNIVLLDMGRRVMASFLAVSRQHETDEYEVYNSPSVGDKFSLDRIMQEPDFELPETQSGLSDPAVAEQLVAQVAGLGPLFAAEVVLRRKSSGRSLAGEIRSLVTDVLSPSMASIYSELPLGHILERNELRLLEKAVVSPIALQSLERSHNKRIFGTIMEAERFYLDELESRTLLERAKLPLLRQLRVVAKRMAERERKLVREQKKFADAESLQRTAQMLTASGMKMDQRYEKATVTDYYGETPAAQEVGLDPALTLRENIDRMFKLHHKAGRGRTMVARQMEEVRNRQQTMEQQALRIRAIRDWDTWLAVASSIREEEKKTGGTNPESRKSPSPQGRRFRGILVDGHEILVGRSSRENDELTFQIASSDDFWLHAGDYSGSHVVIRNPSRAAEPPQNVLTKAAQLAAYFSRARNSAKVEVHYTRRKHVSKPRKAKPGLVKLAEFKSIAVEPRNWLEE